MPNVTQAEVFAALHRGPSPLVLPNVWDAGSARLIEQLGAQAIATTSAGVAWSLGYPDGDALPVDVHLAAAARIARVVRTPLSVDLESGYSDVPAEVGVTVARFIDAGVVGINLQDGSGPPELLAAKIEAARNAALKAGVRLFINARTDVISRGLVEEGGRLAETLNRARLYKAAGADALFPLALTQVSQIRTLVAETGLALSLVAWPELPSVLELGELGVRRVSAGSWLPQALWTHAARLAEPLLAGAYGDLFADAAPYAEVNRRFA